MNRHRVWVRCYIVLTMKCAVVGCNNCSGSKLKHIDGVTFHVFPVNTDIRNTWIRAIKKPNWTPTKYSKICSLHFDENDFYKTKNGYKKLHQWALPKLIIPNQESEGNLFEGTSHTMPNTSQVQESEANLFEGTSHTMPNTSQVQESEAHNLLKFPLSNPVPNIEKDLEPFLKFNDSPRRKTLKREMNMLKIENIRKNKKIKQLQAKNRRLTKKIASFQSLINDLQKKKLILSSDADLLKSIKIKARDLVQRQSHKNTLDKKVKKKSNPACTF